MEINSVLEFIEQIEKLEGERKCSENLYFRGENDIFPQRVPSMYREDKGKAIYPRLVNKGPRDYYYELFEELGWTSNTFSHKTFEQILEIQHYGAVTNILDITTNPLVALFFACYPGNGKDGRVYAYTNDAKKEEHYFERKIMIMTALNFLDRSKIDRFIALFDGLTQLAKQYPLFKETLSQEYTVDELVTIFTDFYTHKEMDINLLLHFSDDFMLPFQSYSLEETRGKKIDFIDDEQAKKSIVEFIGKIIGEESTDFIQFEQFCNNNKLEHCQIGLIKKMKEIMVEFVSQMNDYYILSEATIYPYEVYDIIKQSYVVKATKINERIKNQRGAFIIPGYVSIMGKSIDQVHKELNESINTNISLKIEFTIPSTKKIEILQQLKTIGIDEGFIYPEIANIAKAVLEKYKA
ncbi:FRG domain-containing protein [Abiotrophia sp.]|uniref:FRG domain-containing protein n=1 Tax=Abiotrophia sp. TaxID=76631 RepID=UPI001CAE7F58|nr:FRG domain-containing protein [Abiotrophia sp.]MBF0936186.1 FRG domain-containing protein [Abiotrophia sp.]